MRALLTALLVAAAVGIAGCAPKEETKPADAAKPAAAPAAPAKPADAAPK